MTAAGIIDSCPGCSRPHTAHPIAKINKVKDLALILLISVLSLSSLHLLPKSILSNRFATLFTHNRQLRCSSSVVNPVVVSAPLLFISLLIKNIYRNKQIILRYINSAFPQLHCVEFSFNRLIGLFLTLVLYNPRGCFLKHGVVLVIYWFSWF